VSERSIVVFSAVAGAAVGGLAGYLFLTDAGRRLRQDLEPRLDELVRDLASLQATVGRAREAASQSWRTIREATGSDRRQWHDTQTAPF
jgi:hypothetical protein